MTGGGVGRRISYGFVKNHIKYYYKDSSYLQDSDVPDPNKWHRLIIKVTVDKSVTVYMDNKLMGKFTAHHSTRGYGGPMIFINKSTDDHNYHSRFKNYGVKGMYDIVF